MRSVFSQNPSVQERWIQHWLNSRTKENSRFQEGIRSFGAASQIWTGDLILTKDTGTTSLRHLPLKPLRTNDISIRGLTGASFFRHINRILYICIISHLQWIVQDVFSCCHIFSHLFSVWSHPHTSPPISDTSRSKQKSKISLFSFEPNPLYRIGSRYNRQCKGWDTRSQIKTAAA